LQKAINLIGVQLLLKKHSEVHIFRRQEFNSSGQLYIGLVRLENSSLVGQMFMTTSGP